MNGLYINTTSTANKNQCEIFDWQFIAIKCIWGWCDFQRKNRMHNFDYKWIMMCVISFIYCNGLVLEYYLQFYNTSNNPISVLYQMTMVVIKQWGHKYVREINNFFGKPILAGCTHSTLYPVHSRTYFRWHWI